MSIQIVCKDLQSNKRKLKALSKKGEKAIERTGKDYAKRAPAWIKKSVKQVYAVDEAGATSAGPSVKISGGGANIKVDVKYTGQRLTLKHFKFAPKSQAALTGKRMMAPGGAINFRSSPGKVATLRQPRNVKLKTTVIKGRTVTHAPSAMFVISGRGNNLPWQKLDGDSTRGRVKMMHTVGMPQMVGNKAKPIIEQKLQTETEKRFQNAIRQCF